MSMPANVTRVYQNHTIDSTRWSGFEPRAGDVIVTTSYKSGTTWTLGILYRMLALKEGLAPPAMDYWIDARMLPVELNDQLAELAAMPHRRVLKSHLAADGLPVWPDVRYVVVGRDPRDVFMSLINHYEQFTEFAYSRFNETPGRSPDAIPSVRTSLRTPRDRPHRRGGVPSVKACERSAAPRDTSRGSG